MPLTKYDVNVYDNDIEVNTNDVGTNWEWKNNTTNNSTNYQQHRIVRLCVPNLKSFLLEW